MSGSVIYPVACRQTPMRPGTTPDRSDAARRAKPLHRIGYVVDTPWCVAFCSRHSTYAPTVTLIFFGCAAAAFATRMVTIPSAAVASMASASTSTGNFTERAMSPL